MNGKNSITVANATVMWRQNCCISAGETSNGLVVCGKELLPLFFTSEHRLEIRMNRLVMDDLKAVKGGGVGRTGIKLQVNG